MEKIYMEYGGKVLRYVRSKISDPQDAEDVCASVFLKVQRGLSAYDDSRSSLSTWIYSIAHNAVIDFTGVRGRLLRWMRKSPARRTDLKIYTTTKR